jgi:hypothetical protein
MGYRILGMAVWALLKWLLRRQFRDATDSRRLKLAAGLILVVIVFGFVLSRKEGEHA